MLTQTSLWRRLLKPRHIPRLWFPTTIGTTRQVSIEPPTSDHHDLESFLDYTSRVGADTQSSVYRGTHYEYTVQSSLSRLGINSKRVGGRSDCGIDLLGTWDVPTATAPLKVLVQCRGRGGAARPSDIRELEGAFVGAPSGWRGPGVLGLFVSQRAATKGVRDAIGRSRWPMGYLMCTQQGKMLQMLWNRRADDEGLLNVGVTVRYAGGAKEDREIVLTWQRPTMGIGAST